MKNDYYIEDGILYIIMRRRSGEEIVTFLDEDDFDKVYSVGFTWTIQRMTDNHVYALNWRGGKTVSLHRLLMGEPKGMVIDHINHNTLDNTRKNIRVLEQRENMQNHRGASVNSKSGVRGVYWDRTRSMWMAQFKLGGKPRNLGRYDTIEEAKVVVERERRKYMKYSN